VELAKFKKKFQTRMTSVQEAWESATVVRTREKVSQRLIPVSVCFKFMPSNQVSFFYGVMMVLASALLFGLAPEWLHVVYSVHLAYFLPTRFYVYKKKHWYIVLSLLAFSLLTKLLAGITSYLICVTTPKYFACSIFGGPQLTQRSGSRHTCFLMVHFAN
jgi:hypothetical protein